MPPRHQPVTFPPALPPRGVRWVPLRTVEEQAAQQINEFSNFEGGMELDVLHDSDHDGIGSRERQPNVLPEQIYPHMSKVRRG